MSELIFLPIEVLQNKTNIIWTSKKFGNKSYNFWKIKFLNYDIWGATASILANLSVKVWDTKLQRLYRLWNEKTNIYCFGFNNTYYYLVGRE